MLPSSEQDHTKVKKPTKATDLDPTAAAGSEPPPRLPPPLPSSFKTSSLSYWLSHSGSGSNSGSNIIPKGITTTSTQPGPGSMFATSTASPGYFSSFQGYSQGQYYAGGASHDQPIDLDHPQAHAVQGGSSTSTPPPPTAHGSSAASKPEKAKRGRKPKPKPDPNDPNFVLPKPAKEKKSKVPKTVEDNPKAFKQSCLTFDVVDADKAKSYFTAHNGDDDRRYGGIMRDIPKLVGRAPYEDLVGGLLMRSSKLPTLHKLELQKQDVNMDMLANIKMVHEFLNTFGTPLGLTKAKDSGEWITFDTLLSMIKNPRMDSRLLDLNYRMVLAAYDDDQSSRINHFNFTYFLAVGPEAVEGNSDEKKNKKRPTRRYQPLNRLGTLEYSSYTPADRIEALAKALHDITASRKFHRFMRDEVEENITTLKRQKRKRTEIRKELETQVHDLERAMKAIERDAAQMETERQSILAAERDNDVDDDGSVRITASLRLQRLALVKDARSKANDLLKQQKALAAELKIKEHHWETKKQELEDISKDDTEIQKDHNIPWAQLRGGYAVNTDTKLRVICLGNDRWGRKYWFWKDFGGVLVEDRDQIGPKLDTTAEDTSLASKKTESDKITDVLSTDSRTAESHMDMGEAMEVEQIVHKADQQQEDETVTDMTRRMMAMASLDLTGNLEANDGQGFQSTKSRMSINNLLIDDASPQHAVPITTITHPETSPLPFPERDMLDYGPVQTWSLISTTKELASLTRALNGKGARERVLKASLITMRKEIEESFPMITKWAGNHCESKFEHLSELGALGQPLTLTEFHLLKKKRGRKSKQELADIAATEELITANEGVEAMDVDSSVLPIHDGGLENGGDQIHGHGHDNDHVDNRQDHDHIMEENESESTKVQVADLVTDHQDSPREEQALQQDSNMMEEVDTPHEDEETYGEDTGLTGSEYLDTIVKAAGTKIRDFSRTIFGGDENAIINAVKASNPETPSSPQERLANIVQILERCLDAMDDYSGEHDEEPEAKEGEMSKEQEEVSNKNAEKKSDDNDTAMEDVVGNETKERNVGSEDDKLPVSVSPRLLGWLQVCGMDEMLKRVQTYGALHAWLDECSRAVADFVDDGYDEGDEEEESEGEGKADEIGEDSEDSDNHDHEEGEDEDDDEGKDEGKDEQEDEEREETGEEKAQDEHRSEYEKGQDDHRSQGRHLKSRKQPKTTSRTTTVGGHSLRSRGAVPISYKMELVADDEDEDDEEDDEEEEEGEEEEERVEVVARLSSRTRSTRSSTRLMHQPSKVQSKHGGGGGDDEEEEEEDEEEVAPRRSKRIRS
ncbi:hypothetical protein BG004_006645 [Podila humilis]|nr:hypothetical protein BG004_006645 [Podila humilis]